MPLYIFLLSILFPPSILAAESTSPIVISEIQIEPEQSVELINTSASSQDISQWYIDDDGGTTFFTIPDGTILLPQSCVVLTGSFNLNKSSSDTVRIFDNSNPPTSTQAILIDSHTYDRSPGSSVSFQRSTNGEWTAKTATLGFSNDTLEKCTIDPTATMTPTPSPSTQPTPNTTLTPSPSPQAISNIYISEFYPAPYPTEKEWVELYNNNDMAVTLSNWYIDDGEDEGASPKKFTFTIPRHGYEIVELSTAILNNSGDTVRLLNASQIEVDAVTYDNTEGGVSIGWDGVMSAHYCLQDRTPRKENNSCSQKEEKMLQISSTNHEEVLGISQTSIPATATQQKISKSHHFLIPATVPSVQSIKQSPLNDQSQSISEYPNQPHSISSHLKKSQTFDPFPFSSIALLSIFSIAAKMKLQL